MSTTQSLPSRACLCAASMAPCALRPGRNPWLASLKCGSNSGCITVSSSCCTNRSSTLGMLNGRMPPLGLGISLRRAALGLKLPLSSLALIPAPCFARCSRSCFVFMPSGPGAPALRSTELNAASQLSASTAFSIVASCIAILFPGCRVLTGMPLSSPLAVAAPLGRFGFVQRVAISRYGLLTAGRLLPGSQAPWSLCIRSFGPSLRHAFAPPHHYYGLC
jgi:hypothetical protein